MLRNQEARPVVLSVVYQHQGRGILKVQRREPVPEILIGWICNRVWE